MSIRDEVVNEVKALLPDGYATVDKYAQEVDPPRKPLIMVRLDEVQPVPEAGAGARVHLFGLIVLASRLETGPADDELEDSLELVLWSIDRGTSNLHWTNARRVTYKQSDGNEYPAFEVSLRLPHTVTDPTEE